MRADQESIIRLTTFITIFVVMSLLETILPRRNLTQSRSRRAIRNLSLVAINTLVLRLLPFLSAVGVSIWAQSHGIGLLNVIQGPAWLEILLAVVLFDLLIFGQHVATHYLPVLWRFHRVHHADRDLDATSGLRFHTVEIIFSMIVKCMGAISLGPAPEAVILFEIVLNGTSIFNHSNIRVPCWIDRVLRWFIVTPDMHRVHHSVRMTEANRNFGFSLPWWDWIFATYLARPNEPHQTMTLGLPDSGPTDRPETLLGMLAMPFRPRQR